MGVHIARLETKIRIWLCQQGFKVTTFGSSNDENAVRLALLRCVNFNQSDIYHALLYRQTIHTIARCCKVNAQNVGDIRNTKAAIEPATAMLISERTKIKAKSEIHFIGNAPFRYELVHKNQENLQSFYFFE